MSVGRRVRALLAAITAGAATLVAGASGTAATAAAKPAASTAGMVSLTFDDGQLGQYQNARPMLRSAGIHGTFYVISDALGWGGTSMTAAQVRTLAVEGDEIGNHSRDHADLSTLSAAQIAAEFADSQAVLQKATGRSVTTCAYPFGTSNDVVRSLAATYFTGCRGTASGQNSPRSLARYDLAVYYVHTGTTAAQVRAAAQQARTTGAWVIFVYHGIGAIGSDDDVSAATFRAHVAAVKATGVPVRTVAAALAALGR